MCIYVLKNPNNKEIFYIGITTQKNPKVRLNQHCNHALRQLGNNYKKNKYINDLTSKGLRPELVVIQECINAVGPYLERYWINCYKRLGCKLLNLTDGGETVDPEFSRKGGFLARGIKPKTRKFSSKYVGVRWHKTRKKWQAYTSIGKKQYHLGLYTIEEDAAKAYDKAILLLIKDQPLKLNFPNKKYELEGLEEWLNSFIRIKSSKHKHIHYAKIHDRWVVRSTTIKSRVFKTEDEAIAYLTSISNISH